MSERTIELILGTVVILFVLATLVVAGYFKYTEYQKNEAIIQLVKDKQ